MVENTQSNGKRMFGHQENRKKERGEPYLLR